MQLYFSPKDVLDPSRDRTSLNSSDLENIAGWINKNMDGYSVGREQRLKFIHMLEPYWKNGIQKKKLQWIILCIVLY